jgi:hypothetical protein
MRLTLDIDGKTNTINMEGEPEDRLEAMQGMCKMLLMMASQRPENTPEGDDKDYGC